MNAPLDVPDSPTTFAAVINPAGVITGEYFDASNAPPRFPADPVNTLPRYTDAKLSGIPLLCYGLRSRERQRRGV